MIEKDDKARRAILQLAKAMLSLKQAIDSLAVQVGASTEGGSPIEPEHGGSEHLKQAMQQVQIAINELKAGSL